MEQNKNILQELKELESSLVHMAAGNIYSVPAGYFEGLATQVLNRIKALEATTVAEELSYLSPVLNNIPRDLPYSVPVGYFDGLDKTVLMAKDLQPDEELESISPLLSGLKKQIPYEVPQGYFDSLSSNVRKEEDQKTKVVSIFSGKWMKYAAAAVVTGAIAITTYFVIDKKDAGGISLAKFERKLNKEIKKMSDTELTEFLEYSEPDINRQENVSVNTNDEIQELLKDVPDSELKEFIEETSDLETEPSVMNE